MNTLQMLKNVRDFVVKNRGAGTTSAVEHAAGLSGAYALYSNLWKNGTGRMGLDMDFHYLPERVIVNRPVFIDNGALIEILYVAIEEIEKLQNPVSSSIESDVKEWIRLGRRIMG
jgi:hypothetical protein